MKKGVTLKDIAKKLNMSVSTVSKALSNDVSISAFTKERVQNLAKEWNYIPNESARHFKLNKSFTIGLIIPDLLDQFYVLAINGVESIAGKQDYNVIVSQSNDDVTKEENFINLMIRNRVDGVIIAITKKTIDKSLFQKMTSIGIPVVFIARDFNEPEFNYVLSDNEEGAFKVTEFLIKKGHRRVAYIMGPKAMQTCQIRLEGYMQALLKHKIPIDDKLIKAVDFTVRSTSIAMESLMKMDAPPTGIFTYKNYIALDAIEFLKKQYPDRANKIDFAGFGNLPLLQYLDHKPLASIEENSFEMGAAAANLLFKLMEDKSEGDTIPQRIQIPCRLISNK